MFIGHPYKIHSHSRETEEFYRLIWFYFLRVHLLLFFLERIKQTWQTRTIIFIIILLFLLFFFWTQIVPRWKCPDSTDITIVLTVHPDSTDINFQWGRGFYRGCELKELSYDLIIVSQDISYRARFMQVWRICGLEGSVR